MICLATSDLLVLKDLNVVPARLRLRICFFTLSAKSTRSGIEAGPFYGIGLGVFDHKSGSLDANLSLHYQCNVLETSKLDYAGDERTF